MTRIDAAFLHDPALIAVLDVIEDGGHRALLVGGCVRNALIGAVVADVDIATDARPTRVIELATAAGLRVVPTGIDHGTVTIVSGGTGFEVTTFRRDVETDGRRAVVAFSDRLEDDAARRDFTMNALYAARDGRVIDPVDGLPDLAARHLRFVGKARARITEDYLRILRLFRFLAWYGRDVHSDAIAACTELSAGLEKISAERITAELRKLLAAPDPGPAMALMAQTGVLPHVLPGATPQALPALIALEKATGTAPDWPRRLALLTTGTAHLRLSRAEAKAQENLTKARHWPLGKTAYHLGPAWATDAALIAAARGTPLPDDWRAIIASAAPLPITAADLLPDLTGPALGRALATAETRWIASGFTLDRLALIAAARTDR
ncbi:MAG: CCA tRNA nucleotidyltransferase [Paracoccus sp. (in: a-proteobacteria)]|uniref:CCA tRNA nucleotidyltransferase n=1 Tax=Paracoccus sp. TaxID=267 RepID=UPI0026DFF7A8|nr:CCA tRNA nucleotidyltransferase [Paracoccus sp. (in: a-proteobacteria)]MDO5630800.1 CCA tRNA nucleotidyltransferase [Paracoccus sp. (in: a-proteobacteria)]